MEVVAGALGALLKLAYFGLGVFLRRTNAFNFFDGLAALRFSIALLVPVLLVALDVNRVAFTQFSSRPLILINLGHFLFLWLWTWLACRKMPLRERGIMTAAGISLSGIFSGVLPLRGIASDWLLVKDRLVPDLATTIISAIAAYTLFVSTQRRAQYSGVMPSKYRHVDGGVYSGEWKGTSKHGFGVYSYPSGSVYSGQWKDNVKCGMGAYHYGEGGAYIGGWENGNPDGIGIRIYKSGKSKTGTWKRGKLRDELPSEVCEPFIGKSIQVSSKAKATAKERCKPTYQKVLSELSCLLPLMFVLFVSMKREMVSAFAPLGVARAILTLFEPLMLISCGLLSANLDDSGSAFQGDAHSLILLRYALSCSYIAFAMLLLPKSSAHYTIVGSALPYLLCPVSPLVLTAEQYSKRSTIFMRHAVGLSMVVSLVLTCTLQTIYAVKGTACLSNASMLAASTLLVANYFVRKRQSRSFPGGIFASSNTTVGNSTRVSFPHGTGWGRVVAPRVVRGRTGGASTFTRRARECRSNVAKRWQITPFGPRRIAAVQPCRVL